jgi:hypothetical protein
MPCRLIEQVKEETAEKEEAEDEEGEENDSDVGEGNEEEDEEEDAIITKETKKARKEAELEEMVRFASWWLIHEPRDLTRINDTTHQIRGLQVKQVFKNMRVKSDFWTEEDQAAPEELKDLEVRWRDLAIFFSRFAHDS